MIEAQVLKSCGTSSLEASAVAASREHPAEISHLWLLIYQQYVDLGCYALLIFFTFCIQINSNRLIWAIRNKITSHDDPVGRFKSPNLDMKRWQRPRMDREVLVALGQGPQNSAMKVRVDTPQNSEYSIRGICKGNTRSFWCHNGSTHPDLTGPWVFQNRWCEHRFPARTEINPDEFHWRSLELLESRVFHPWAIYIYINVFIV